MHGHLLGAAGALEAAVCIASLQLGKVPATLGSAPLDERCLGLDLPESPRLIPGLKRVMSNSFAFGGSNASLIFGTVE